MNNPKKILTLLVAAAALTPTLTGCNPAADAHPTQTIGTCTDCTTAPTPAATTTTLDAAAKEKADRAAAEAAWRKFNALVGSVETLPADQVDAAVDAVAIDPTAAAVKNENQQFRAENKAGYGQIISHMTWDKPIAASDIAVLNDCQDGSQSGVLDTKTGNKLVVGTSNTPFKGTLTRTATGWKVMKAELLGGTCTPTG